MGTKCGFIQTHMVLKSLYPRLQHGLHEQALDSPERMSGRIKDPTSYPLTLAVSALSFVLASITANLVPLKWHGEQRKLELVLTATKVMNFRGCLYNTQEVQTLLFITTRVSFLALVLKRISVLRPPLSSVAVFELPVCCALP